MHHDQTRDHRDWGGGGGSGQGGKSWGGGGSRPMCTYFDIFISFVGSVTVTYFV